MPAPTMWMRLGSTPSSSEMRAACASCRAKTASSARTSRQIRSRSKGICASWRRPVEWHTAPTGRALAHERRDEVEMVADHDVGGELLERLADARREGALEQPGHLRREVAVAGRRVGHHVGHPADVEGELRRVEPHGVDARGGGQGRRPVLGPEAADDGGLVPHRNLAPHRLGEVDAAAGGVGLLRRDVEDAHGSPLPGPPSGPRRSGRSSPASPRTRQPRWSRCPQRRARPGTRRPRRGRSRT